MNTDQAIALSSRNVGRSSLSLQGCTSQLLIASGEKGVRYVALMLGHRFTNSAADQDLYRRAGERIYYGTHGLASPKSAGRNARAMRRLAGI